MKRSLNIFVLVVLWGSTYGQQQFGLGVNTGYLMAHRSDLKNLESRVHGLEFNWERSHIQSEWAEFYNKPVIGFGVNYYTFNRTESGKAIALHGNFRIQLLQLGNSSLDWRFSTGLAYLTKTFDPFENRRNQAIGSHLNAYIQTAFLFQFTPWETTYDLGVGLAHFSNAAYKTPNLGYNIPLLFLRGIVDANTAAASIRDSLTSTLHRGQWSWSANTVFSKKERNLASPVAFYPYGVMGRVYWRANPIRQWRAGLDAISDKTYAYQKDNEVALDKLKLNETLELGVAFGHEWRVSQLRFLMEFGYYIHKPEDFKNPFYQRMGFNYNAYKQWGFIGNLKFHRGVADYAEFGIMYTLEP